MTDSHSLMSTKNATHNQKELPVLSSIMCSVQWSVQPTLWPAPTTGQQLACITRHQKMSPACRPPTQFNMHNLGQARTVRHSGHSTVILVWNWYKVSLHPVCFPCCTTAAAGVSHRPPVASADTKWHTHSPATGLPRPSPQLAVHRSWWLAHHPGSCCAAAQDMPASMLPTTVRIAAASGMHQRHALAGTIALLMHAAAASPPASVGRRQSPHRPSCRP